MMMVVFLLWRSEQMQKRYGAVVFDRCAASGMAVSRDAIPIKTTKVFARASWRANDVRRELSGGISMATNSF